MALYWRGYGTIGDSLLYLRLDFHAINFYSTTIKMQLFSSIEDLIFFELPGKFLLHQGCIFLLLCPKMSGIVFSFDRFGKEFLFFSIIISSYPIPESSYQGCRNRPARPALGLACILKSGHFCHIFSKIYAILLLFFTDSMLFFS